MSFDFFLLIYPPNMSGYEFCVRRVPTQSRVARRPLLYGIA